MSISEIGQSVSSMCQVFQAQNQNSSDDSKTIIDELDSDGDGVLSVSEISDGGEHVQNILEADTDEDGYVTQDELASHMSSMGRPPMGPPPSEEEMAEDIISQLDTDGNGTLSTDEVSESEHAQELLGADTNSDGIVSQEELMTVLMNKVSSFEETSSTLDSTA